MTKKTIVKNKGGRPKTNFDQKQIAKVAELSAYLNCEQIADYFGISHITFQEIRRRQEEVSFAYKKGKAQKIRDYVQKLENKAMGIDEQGDTTAIIFFLKTQAGWTTEAKSDNKIKLKFPESKSPSDIIDTALIALEQGEITFTEAQNLANLAMTKLNVNKLNDTSEEAVKERESMEELMDKAYTIRKVLEHQEKMNKGN